MNDLIAASKQMLEALKHAAEEVPCFDNDDLIGRAIAAGSTAIEQTKSDTEFPLATEADKKLGWKLNYRWLEKVSNATAGRPSMETVEDILLKARSIK